MEDTLDAVVIGAGFAGLGTGAALKARGLRRFAIVEQGNQVGAFWTTTYDRLHLHSAFHDMPHDGGLRAGYPIFLSRNQLLEYFRRYAERHGLEPHLRFGTTVTRVKRVEGGTHPEWEIETTAGRLRAGHVAVATAANRVPSIPHIADREAFRGRVLHSVEYRNPRPFVGHAVLVVGSGNSAAEIALDLSEGGARSVSIWVRGPRHFIPIGRMATLFRVMRLLRVFSAKQLVAVHAITRGTPAFDRTIATRDKLIRRFSVDLSRYGIRKPKDGPMAEGLGKGRIPTFDQGAIAKIRSGAIRVIDGNVRSIAGFTADGVRFSDGAEPFDDVVLATGFEPRVEEFIADAELLGPAHWFRTYPLTDGRSRSRIHPSMFFPGFDLSPNGGTSLGLWGWEVGGRIADELR